MHTSAASICRAAAFADNELFFDSFLSPGRPPDGPSSIPAGAEKSAYLSMDAGQSAYLSMDAGQSAYLSMDARQSAYLSMDAGQSAYLPMDAGRSAYLPMGQVPV
eukprot:365282-Chlamydomonas_euryale.AAC.14